MSSTTAAVRTTSYGYDGDGSRYERTVSSGSPETTRYLWDLTLGLPQLALVRDGAGEVLRRYAYGDSRVLLDASGQRGFYHTDRLGSVTALSSGTGARLSTHSYESFGKERNPANLASPPTTSPFRFTGEYRDATTGLDDLRARQYDPSTGRFTSLDPLPRSLTDPYVASYVYADNRPTVLVDPSGMGAIGNTCASITCWLDAEDVGCGAGVLCWLRTNGKELGINTIKVGYGCFAGGIAGEAAIAGPVGLTAALFLGPEAALLLPAAGCVIGAGVVATEIAMGYEGPSWWP